MSRKPSSAPPRVEPFHARNPRDIAEPPLDATPPQPPAPERSEIAEEQDHQPVNPAPLIGQAPNLGRGTREEKNG